MPDTQRIVINTGPILAVTAGLGSLNKLNFLYEQVIVPWEVCREIMAGGSAGFGIREFAEADFLIKTDGPALIQPYLQNSLNSGESSVIQTASVIS